MEILNAHLEVHDIESLANYIEQRLGPGHDFVVTVCEDRYLRGYVDGLYYDITFDDGKYLTLGVDTYNGYTDTYQLMKKIVSPVMWYCEPGTKPACMGPYCEIIFNNGLIATSWSHAENLEEIIETAAMSIKNCDIPKENVTLFYGDKPIDYYMDRVKYGNYTGYFRGEVDEINNYKEFELYYAIKSWIEKYKEIAIIEEEQDVDMSDKLDMIDYNLAYLVQQTKRFGVEVDEPSDKPQDPSLDFRAWYAWWTDKFDDLIDNNPGILEVAFTDKSKDIKPSGSYKDYLDIVSKEEEDYEFDVVNKILDEETNCRLRLVKDDDDEDDDENKDK